jgi:hypothetical protein
MSALTVPSLESLQHALIFPGLCAEFHINTRCNPSKFMPISWRHVFHLKRQPKKRRPHPLRRNQTKPERFFLGVNPAGARPAAAIGETILRPIQTFGNLNSSRRELEGVQASH